jgi:tripartite-type tricarboxylate transporter receptor subunit TctC
MRLARRAFGKACLAACAIGILPFAAVAQNYPTKPIVMVVPFPPGGPSDVVARVIAEGMSRAMGSQIVIENVGGAGGTIGSHRVVRAAPDGYTILLGIWNTHVAVGALFKLEYDIVKDFQPIALLSDAPLLLAVHKDVPVKDFKQTIAWLKANPDKASSGSAGIGSPPHLLDEVMRKHTGTEFRTVHYRGAGPIMQDLLTGQLQLGFINPATALPHVRAGAIRAVGVTSASRMKLAPDVPTMTELGLPALEFSLWAGIYAPKGTPKEIVDTLNRSIKAALADPDIRERMERQGIDIAPADRQTPEALAQEQKAGIEKWWPIIKAAGITAN